MSRIAAGGPPTERTGPAGNGTGYVSLGCATDSTDRFELWGALESCPPEALQWAALGWHIGQAEAWRDGFDAGYRAAELDMELHWFALACKVRRDAGRPPFAQLQRRRGELTDELPGATG